MMFNLTCQITTKKNITFSNFAYSMGEPGGPNIARGLGNGKPRDLENLLFGQQWFHQQSAGAILRPLGNSKNEMPIETVDFGWMLDVHKSFLAVKKLIDILSMFVRYSIFL